MHLAQDLLPKIPAIPGTITSLRIFEQVPFDQKQIGRIIRPAANRNITLGSYELQNGPTTFDGLRALLKRCGEAKDLLQGRHVHAYISSCFHDRNTFLGNCLVEMYGNCGSIEEAQAAFDRIPRVNSYSWNILMKAYVKNGNGKEALDIFTRMQLDGIKTGQVTLACAIDACASLTAQVKGRLVHSTIIEHGHERNIVVGTALVKMYGSLGNVHDARSMFDQLLQRDVISWSAIISACTQNGHEKEALELYYQMQLALIKLDPIAFLCALDACASLATLEGGQQIHAAVVMNGYEVDCLIGTALVNMYGKCGDLHSAQDVFNQMPYRNIVSWSSIIAVCAQNGHDKEALDFFHQMQFDGFSPDHATLVCAIDACSSLATLEEGKKIHAFIAESGHGGGAIIGTALINMYGNCGNLNDARSLFDMMDQHDVVSWSVMIAACVQSGCSKDALEYFHQMWLVCIKPDQASFVCALDACASLANLEDGQEIHTAIVGNGFEEDTTVGTALVNMYGKCGSLHNATRVFYLMPSRNLVTWGAIIGACAQNGHYLEAQQFFREMKLKQVGPNEVTFLNVLTACSHSGQVDDGWHYFVSISQDYGLTQTVDHYVCMIDLLSRAGHLDDAECLLDSIPLEKKALVLSCLLSACRIHGDVKRGARVACHIFRLDPNNAAPYITLLNIYEAAGW